MGDMSLSRHEVASDKERAMVGFDVTISCALEVDLPPRCYANVFLWEDEEAVWIGSTGSTDDLRQAVADGFALARSKVAYKVLEEVQSRMGY